METTNNLTAYCYKANDSKSYYALAEYVAKSISAKLILIPSELTIIVEPTDTTAPILAVGNFIDDQAINFHIEPVEPVEESLTGVISEITEQLTERNAEVTALKKERDDLQYSRKYYQGKADRIKEQVKAIGTLLNAIYKETY